MNESFYDESTKQIEIFLRGRTLQVCSVIEMLLAQLLIISRADEPERKAYNFKQLHFAGKILEAISALKDKFPAIYEQYSKDFDELIALKDKRNKIAHCRFEWLDNDLSIISIWDLSDKEGISGFEINKYTFQDLVEVIEQLKKIVLKLNEIVTFLRIDFDRKYPGVLFLFSSK